MGDFDQNISVLPGHLGEFLDTERMRLLNNLEKLNGELRYFWKLDELYKKPINGSKALPQNYHFVLIQLFTLCHSQLYTCTALILRDHLQEAFAILRIAVEASLHAYRIITNPDDYQKYIERCKSFRHSAVFIRSAREKDSNSYLLAIPLLEVWSACSEYASHADYSGFLLRQRHIKESLKEEYWLFYFKPEESISNEKYNLLYFIQIYTRIGRIYGSYFEKLEVVKSDWKNNLLKLENDLGVAMISL